jgi:hypothetical protein
MNSVHLPKDLEFGIQNCQSLNISTKNKKTDLKVNALVKKKCDVIFLSDTRLNTDKQAHAVHDLCKKFALAGYNFYYHSPTSSRGVGILISKKVNSVVNDRQIVDDDGNFMILKTTINNIPVAMCAVYGPNHNDMQFFDSLEGCLRNTGIDKLILGGGL